MPPRRRTAAPFLLALLLPACAASAATVGWRGTTPAVPVLGLPAAELARVPGLTPIPGLLPPQSSLVAPSALPNLYSQLLPPVVPVRPAQLAVPAALPVLRPGFQVPIGRVNELALAAAPELTVLQQAGLSDAAARRAGERLVDALLASPGGPASAGPTAPAGGSGGGRRGGGSGANARPLVSQVSFAPAVEARHQTLFDSTLRRRKAAWIRELARQGVQLEGPVEPAFSVREARDLTPGASTAVRFVDFVVDWAQGETRVGSFRVTVRLKDLQVTLRGLPPPPVPEEKQVRVRFQATATPAMIAEFLEQRGLRLLSRHWEGEHRVAVTGQADADAVSRALNGKGLVLYATPAKLDVPADAQFLLVFKRSTVLDSVEYAVDEPKISEFLSTHGLRVLERTRDGVYRVQKSGSSGDEAADDLKTDQVVLYASPVAWTAPEASQAVLRLKKDVSDDQAASLLLGLGLRVVLDLGGGTYKVAGPGSGSALAAALSSEPAVQSAVAVGTLSDDRVRASALSAASYKGGIYSATEFNLHSYEHRHGLVLAGATAAQLELFERLLGEAPVRGGRFNPWSGD